MDTAPSQPTAPTAVRRDEEVIAPDPTLESDDELWDGASIMSSTKSLTESITEYRHLHGRTYTQKTDYYGPNDEKQNEGLDLNHYCMTLFLDDKLFFSPIGGRPQRVLDLGTGTGIWAIDFADEFPSAEVVGVDISPIQPSWVPPNCKFQIDDIEKLPWTWPTDHFDLIHIRNLEGCVADWPALYAQAFGNLKPGSGYIEVKETDFNVQSQHSDNLDDDHPYKKWTKVMFEAFEKIRKTARQHRDHGIAKNLKSAGFVDIVEKKWQMPIGAWAKDPKFKEIGACYLEYLDQSLEGFGTFLLKEIMGWEYTKILIFMSEMREALRDTTLQPKIDVHLVYARRPEKSMEDEA